ncbi:ribosome silencing factor [Bacillus fonticola]|uniref:ribosome silencing factor n=1 Tax=Bacillus fonticola TaxID=2728853 RepID=UPI0014743E2A|nr:ribosome silencing factor [Bacillus fonticola]
MGNQQQLTHIVEAVVEKKAHDVTILRMEGISLLTDYFVICHGNSDTQVQAIAREAKKQADKHGYQVKRLEGFDEAKWVLLDAGDCVLHVFHRDERPYYHLERLWGDAELLTVDDVIPQ